MLFALSQRSTPTNYSPAIVRGFVILGAALLSLIPPGDEAIATLVQKKQHWLLRGENPAYQQCEVGKPGKR